MKNWLSICYYNGTPTVLNTTFIKKFTVEKEETITVWFSDGTKETFKDVMGFEFTDKPYDYKETTFDPNYQG